MRYNDKYPDKTDALKLNPDRLLGPHPEIEVEPGIWQTWRVFPCDVCRKPNSWRVDFEDRQLNVCGDECFHAAGGQYAAQLLPAMVEGRPELTQRAVDGVMSIVPAAFLDAGQRAAEEAAKQHQELVREEEKNVIWEGEGVDTPKPA